MIVRVFRAKIRSGKLRDWQQRVETHSIPFLTAQTGLVAFYPGKPIDPVTREFSMVSIWNDIEAVKAFTGEDFDQPIYAQDEGDLVEESYLHHYELFGPPAAGTSNV